MADKKLNELGTTESFDNAYVELSQNQYRISKTNLGKQLTNEVHTNFSVASSRPAYIYAQKSDGTNFRISKANLAIDIRNDEDALLGVHLGNRALYDGCFIMYHSTANGKPCAVPYANWIDLQNSGEEADGVLIVESGHSLVVAPHEKSCYWSTKPGTATGTMPYSSENRIKLLTAWNGRTNTVKICTNSSSPFYVESNNPSTKDTYAPGFCYNYTPHVTGKPGLKAGKYWLPCVAELMMIYTHKYRINAGMELIFDATKLSESTAFVERNYWSSTESNENCAWTLDLKYGILTDILIKTSDRLKVRPVSAFFHEGY